MKKIAIIGAGEFQAPLILKAKEMKIETHVFAWEEGALGKSDADFFYPISIRDKENILDKCKEINIDGVASVASDLAVLTVNYIAREMGYPCNTAETDLITTNKYMMRNALKNANISTPKYAVVNTNTKIDYIKNEYTLPIIIKPTDRSGSRGVTKINNMNELEKAIMYAINESFEKRAIVEEFIDGEEFSCECISFEKEHKFIACTKKYTTGAPYFVERGHLQPAFVNSEQNMIIFKEVAKALDALGVEYGASHCEFKLDSQNNMKIIEIGARMAGDCIGTHLVKLSTNHDYIKYVIQCALGESPSYNEVINKYSFIRFVMSDDDIQVCDRIVEDDKEIMVVKTRFKPAEKELIKSSGDRRGFYILQSNNYDRIEQYITKQTNGLC